MSHFQRNPCAQPGMTHLQTEFFGTVFWTMGSFVFFVLPLMCVWLGIDMCRCVEKVNSRATVLGLYSFGNTHGHTYIYIYINTTQTNCLCSAGGGCSFIVCQTIIMMWFDNHLSWVSGWPGRCTRGSTRALDLTAFDKGFSLLIKLRRSRCSRRKKNKRWN